MAELVRRGFVVRALARDPARLGVVRPFCDDVVCASAADLDAVRDAADSCDVVFTSIGSRSLKRRPPFWSVDHAANINLLEAARTAGVPRFLFVSVLRGNELRRRVPMVEARERVVDALPVSGLQATVMRPNGFFNDLREVFEMARRSTVWVFSGGRARGNPVHGADLAAACVAAIDDPAAINSEVRGGGPQTMTAREIAELAFEVLGKRPRIRSLPAWLVRALAQPVRLFNANMHTVMVFMAAVLSEDMLAPESGVYRMRGFFEQLRDNPDTALQPDVSDLTPAHAG